MQKPVLTVAENPEIGKADQDVDKVMMEAINNVTAAALLTINSSVYFVPTSLKVSPVTVQGNESQCLNY
eukprot:scaffold4233_cov180-Ochromonas_danica.AAC.20